MLFGAEPWVPYNRVRLTPLLAGEINADALHAGYDLPDAANFVYSNRKIVAIDCRRRTVTDAGGAVQPYNALVLATGSSPHVPAVPGIDLPGVFLFRSAVDASRLVARSMRSRRAVVIGGGLLGLEAARGLRNRNIEVAVVEHAPRLMARQLDDAAAELLAAHVTAAGIGVVLGDGLRQIVGVMGVESVRLASGRDIACDTVVIAAGIKPNIGLALDAGLNVGRGVRVDDALCTSDPHIFAIGECAEHRGIIYGLAAPGLEQAGVVAHNLAGASPQAVYVGSTAATKLKTVGLPVFSIGAVGEEENPAEIVSVAHGGDAVYRKLALRRGRLVGAIAVGDWAEINRVQEAVVRGRRVWPWQLWRFRRAGGLWPERDDSNVAAWPATATVCNCTGVTVGALRAAMAAGAGSVEALARNTGASTVCGSCRPLVRELVGESVGVSLSRGWRSLAGLSFGAALLAAAIGLSAPWSVSETVQVDIAWDALWLDGTLKQMSGYTLLGLAVLSLVLSVRKRWRRFHWGGFSGWRLVHAALGAATLAILVAHTGFRLGANLNQALILNFLALAALGAGAGMITAAEARLSPAAGRRLRQLSVWAHLLLAWPLPVLLAFHVLAVYYF